MKNYCLSFNFIWVFLLIGFFTEGQNDSIVLSKNLSRVYCASCHIAPNPNDLPRALWEKNVLPAMGSYYGVQTNGFGLLKKMKPEELKAIKALHIYPETQVISNESWKQIKDYYLNNAPEKFKNTEDRKKRTRNLKTFKRKDIDLIGYPGSLISSLNYNDEDNKLWVGEDRAMAYSWGLKKGHGNIATTNSVVSHIVASTESVYFLEMGSIFPTELNTGTLSVVSKNQKKIIIDNLHRPVHLNVNDLNGDGNKELIICNFGNKTGGLVLYEQLDGTYREKLIHNQSGAIKCIVKDMNDDGKKDLVALFSQGDESMYIFFQIENLKFEKHRILRFNPLMGSNDFVLTDYDGDGDMDIIVAQGDNADISVRPKPYHGIRLFINTNNQFEEQYFYPIYGATKVIAHDFDQDGDIDIAATAFFQDYQNVPNEGFIYLENINSKNFDFESYSLKNSDPIKSYTLEKGDLDQDGDMDIILGLFSWSITNVPQALKTLWLEADYDMTVLFNKLK